MPIQHNDPRLEFLQANIVKGHGRKRAVNIFFNIIDARKAAQWIGSRAITSARQQLDDTLVFKRSGIGGGVLRCLGLSAAGLSKLGVDVEKAFGKHEAFSTGMASRRKKLTDPEPGSWDFADPDGWLLLADDDAEALDEATLGDLGDAAGAIELQRIERGDQLFDAHARGIEHFGYVDGRSQPLFLAEDIAAEAKAARTSATHFIWNPAFPDSQVLFNDPLIRHEHAFASFAVFRKLEQNVRAFKRREAELGQQLALFGEAAERAGAVVVGRFEDGTPVVLSDHEAGAKAVFNDFDYASDQHGQRCPFHAHVRATNPRDGSERAFLMARRGITYGERPDLAGAGGEEPEGGVGLLFAAYMTSIEKQFERTQQLANVADPVIGQGITKPQSWPTAVPGIDCPFRFADFVRMRGGGYFLAPSIPAIRSLAQMNPAGDPGSRKTGRAKAK